MDGTPRERRCCSRIQVDGVFVYASGAVRGRVVDLSRGGMSLITNRRVRPGDKLKFRITSEVHTKVRGRVRWSRLERLRAHEDGSFEPLYAAGLTVLEPARDGREE